jgi:hypothetical protein
MTEALSGRLISLPEVKPLRASVGAHLIMDEVIYAAAKKAFAAQGMAAFENPIEAAAIHEAGHCVMYAALGRSIPEHCRFAYRGRAGSNGRRARHSISVTA